MILSYEEIDREEWSRLVRTSATGTWFQTPEAYEFFASQPELFVPFVVGIACDPAGAQTQLRGVCVGYVTKEKSGLKQYFTRRAIILGGPSLADDATDEEVTALLEAVKTKTRHPQSLYSDLHETTHQSACMQAFRQSEDLSLIAVEQQDASQKHAALTKNTKNIFYRYEPIYIETRNFNDYSKWKGAFEKAGFEYQPHLNFHVDTSSVELVEANLGKSRKRDIRTTIREGVTIVELNGGLINDDATLNGEMVRLVHEYYEILSYLYKTKVKTPLFPESFFQTLAKHPDARFLLTELNGKIIGGTVCVAQEGKCLYEWFACGEDGVYPHVFPSCYATYSGIRYAAEHNMPRFDMMGAGKPDEAYGVRDFKAKFGGKEVEHGRFICTTKPMLYKIGAFGVKILKRIK